MSSAREALRNLGLKTRAPKTETVKFDGAEYEVRAPSVRLRAQILIKAGVAEAAQNAKKAAADKQPEKPQDLAKLQITAVIMCTFVPGTDERVFEDADFDQLANDPAGGLSDALAEPAIKFLNASMDKDAAKNV